MSRTRRPSAHILHLLASFGLLMILGEAPVWGQARPTPNTARSDSDRERARRLAEEGRRAYQAGEFERAEGLLRGAYALDASPILVYNLAQILDAKGDTREAHRTYARFLELDPDTAFRPRIERRIEVLDELLRKEEVLQNAAALPSPPPTVEVSVQSSGGTPVIPWVMVGTGAAALGAGGVLGFLAQDKAGQARDEPVQLTAAALLSDGETLATAANVLYVTGGLLAAGGLVWALLAPGSPPDNVGFFVTPDSVSVAGCF